MLGFACGRPRGTAIRWSASCSDVPVPAAWGRGIGCRLHAAAMARLRALGFERASLWMLAGNQRALRFYRREGWVADGRSKLVTGPGGVALEHRGMARPLARAQ